jgi:DMSO/TMAO reductase YedYZ molybdopterin-dependent catalytic subunit
MKDSSERAIVSRRQWLKTFLGLGAGFLVVDRGGLLAGSVDRDTARDGASQLTVRVSRPFDAETPVREFTSFLTPNHLFFVRSHFGPPSPETIGDSQWKLHVGGAVERSNVFTMRSLRQFEPVTMTAVLQCSGNGRAYHRPRVPGVQWERGAVGNAQWTGVRLRDVLQAAGVRAQARHVMFQGADRPVVNAVPLFARSIPLKKALHPDTLLAYEMNGRPLPLLHGAPLRVITPGWMAESCIKWLTHIEVREEEATGYFMQTAYRVPVKSAHTNTAVAGNETAPVEVMPIKSLIASPENGQSLGAGPVTIQGVAWAGETRIAKVEVSMDEGNTWRPTHLVGDDRLYAWRQWRFLWQATVQGTFTILCRATDERGDVQPAASPWNPSGFLWNGWDRVTVHVHP